MEFTEQRSAIPRWLEAPSPGCLLLGRRRRVTNEGLSAVGEKDQAPLTSEPERRLSQRQQLRAQYERLAAREPVPDCPLGQSPISCAV